MKKEIGNFMAAARSGVEYRLRLLCGRPSPLKRFVAVLVIGGVLTVANIWLVATSIYNIGRRDAEADFMELRHIETLKLQRDSIDNLNLNEYEY
jgi:hypothetical protein